VRIEEWQRRARELRTDTHAFYLAVKDPRVPWYAKLSAVCVVPYALSPIDLIPDFIPVIGYLDDLILLSLGIALTIQMIPSEVLSECIAKVQARTEEGKALGWVGATIIIALWILAIGFVFVFTGDYFFPIRTPRSHSLDRYQSSLFSIVFIKEEAL
jgi:uncharacterized membrane protein YkvA (DUF1232 family)